MNMRLSFRNFARAVTGAAALGAAGFVLFSGTAGFSAEEKNADAKGEEKGKSADAKPFFTCDFESPEWFRDFGMKEPPKRAYLVAEDPERKFEPLEGKALCIRVDKGEHGGISEKYRLKELIGEEPEEIYFRYYLRLGDDWNPVRGGKMPGLGGTYGRAGWGGRPVNGRDGWSARGAFEGARDGKTLMGFYCYHADMQGIYGSIWNWELENRGLLENNRWYCIEQYCKMNTPEKNDGILRAWVDGELAFEKTDIRMRDVPDLKIETVWIDVYNGGRWVAETEDHLYIDNVAISRQYIGPAPAGEKKTMKSADDAEREGR